METPEHQEWRARQAVNWAAALKVGLGIGVYLFIFAGGTPWSGAGVASGVLGRPLPWPVAVLALVHITFCVLCLLIIAPIVYRLRIVAALFAGLGTALGLFIVNMAIFTALGAVANVSNGRALAAHIVLGLFGTAAYKAVAVPPPYRDPSDEHEAHSHRPIHR